MMSVGCLPSSLPLTHNHKTSPLQHKKLMQLTINVSSSSPHRCGQSKQNSAAPFAVQNQKLTKLRTLTTTNSAAPGAATPPDQTVEHIVLFKMKPQFTDYETFISAMNSLKCLPRVKYLSSGFIKAIHPGPFPDYNVFLHSRHATKQDLDLYMGHRLKHGFSMTYTEPYYLDYMLVDYIHDHQGPLDHPPKGSALRSVFFKLKEGWTQGDKTRVIKVAKEGLSESIDQLTFGESFEGTTYRPQHKGYQVGTLALFSSTQVLGKLAAPLEFAEKLQSKLRDNLDAASLPVVVDYEVNEVYNGDRDTL